jgi:hypothetical protein
MDGKGVSKVMYSGLEVSIVKSSDAGLLPDSLETILYGVKMERISFPVQKEGTVISAVWMLSGTPL